MAGKAAVFGYGDIGVRGLATLLEAGLEVPLVVTHRDDPDENRWYASVAGFAKKKGLPLLEDPDDKLVYERLKQLQPELIFSLYYRKMLPLALLKTARHGAFNMHGSLLPKYRGRAPLNWAILHGEKETGVTLHEMVEKPDAGGIVDQQAVPVGPDETAVEVFRKMTLAAEDVLRKSLPSLMRGEVKLQPNNLAQGSYFGRRTPEDGRIDWSKGARQIHNLVRAVAPPFPGAFTEFEGKTLWIFRSRMENKIPPKNRRGPYREGGEWFAACGDGKVLRLLEYKQT